MSRCSQCRVELDENRFACTQCGSITVRSAVAGSIECENHVGQPAVAVCMVCGKPVCGDCAVRREEKFYCDTADHVSIGKEWVQLHACSSEFEADLFLANLKTAGIEARAFAQGGHVSLRWIADDLPCHILVQRSEAAAAREIFAKLGFIDEDRSLANS